MAQRFQNSGGNVRELGRQEIQLEEINGNFELDSDEVHFDAAIVNDISVSGAGIELPVALDVGTKVDLIFAAGDWRISVEGRIMWCNPVTEKSIDQQDIDAYRMGIRFNPEHAHDNVIFFMASRSIVNPMAQGISR